MEFYHTSKWSTSHSSFWCIFSLKSDIGSLMNKCAMCWDNKWSIPTKKTQTSSEPYFKIHKNNIHINLILQMKADSEAIRVCSLIEFPEVKIAKMYPLLVTVDKYQYRTSGRYRYTSHFPETGNCLWNHTVTCWSRTDHSSMAEIKINTNT